MGDLKLERLKTIQGHRTGLGGVESVECSTGPGMEWWNGIVEWPF